MGASNQPGRVLPEDAQTRSNSLGVSMTVLNALLDKLDIDEMVGRTRQRVHARWPFRKLYIQLDIQHPGGTATTLRVASRNLSRSGIGLLHSTFIHAKSPCIVHLPGVDGQVRAVPGVMARCTHRGGRVHELGVRFDTQIDLRTYFDGRVAARLVSLERVNPCELTGTVVSCMRTEREQTLLKSLLVDTNLCLRTITLAELMDPGVYDGVRLLIIGHAQEAESGTALLRTMRDKGIIVPALVLTADIQAPPREGLYDLPDVALAATPLPREQFLATIAEILLVRAADSNSRGLGSLDQATASGVLVALIELHNRLERAIKNEDFEALEPLCARLADCARVGRLNEIATLADRVRGLVLLNNMAEVTPLLVRLLAMIESSARTARAA
jgi:hypothetical protein